MLLHVATTVLAGLVTASISTGTSATRPAGGPTADARRLTCDARAHRYVADRARSVIRWKGTKFRGLGSHEGTVGLRSGEVCVGRDGAVRATFVAEMPTLRVTDIPEAEPRANLEQHLRSADFFHVASHPEARLVVTDVRHENRSLHRLSGTLTIRGTTHPVTFYARVWTRTPTHLRAQATLVVDRHRFGVAYRGSTLRDDLVDDTFTIELAVDARAP